MALRLPWRDLTHDHDLGNSPRFVVLTTLLEQLPALLDEEPAIAACLGRRTASLAVAEPAWAVVMASLVRRTGRSPIRVGSGDVIDRDELVATLVAAGYRREYQVEHRGEIAIRGSIVDIWPSTDEVPVRIDLWDDEVERLTEFAVADQRSTIPRAEVELYPCRELVSDDEVRAKAATLVAEQPWGREQWDRLANGELFDGMESWLPWLSGEERVLFDLVDDDALVVVADPRRLRDRGADLRAEEAELASTLAATWAADGAVFPRLHTDWDRLLLHTGAPVWTIDSVPEGPGVETVVASGWGRVVGGSVANTAAQGPVGRIRRLLAED